MKRTLALALFCWGSIYAATPKETKETDKKADTKQQSLEEKMAQVVRDLTPDIRQYIAMSPFNWQAQEAAGAALLQRASQALNLKELVLTQKIKGVTPATLLKLSTCPNFEQLFINLLFQNHFPRYKFLESCHFGDMIINVLDNRNVDPKQLGRVIKHFKLNVDFNPPQQYPMTALMYQIIHKLFNPYVKPGEDFYEKNFRVVITLLNAGADVNCRAPANYTAVNDTDVSNKSVLEIAEQDPLLYSFLLNHLLYLENIEYNKEAPQARRTALELQQGGTAASQGQPIPVGVMDIIEEYAGFEDEGMDITDEKDTKGKK